MGRLIISFDRSASVGQQVLAEAKHQGISCSELIRRIVADAFAEPKAEPKKVRQPMPEPKKKVPPKKVTVTFYGHCGGGGDRTTAVRSKFLSQDDAAEAAARYGCFAGYPCEPFFCGKCSTDIKSVWHIRAYETRPALLLNNRSAPVIAVRVSTSQKRCKSSVKS